MDHIVYVDAQAKELNSLLSGKKSMIIRGATGRKLPHGRVAVGDVLYFINNNAEGVVRARAEVSSVFHSEKMTPEESADLVRSHQDQLQLTDKQVQKWAGKRYLVLVGVANIAELAPFSIDRSGYGNMDDWLLVEQIDKVKK